MHVVRCGGWRGEHAVLSSDGERLYRVSLSEQDYSCSCPDHTFRSHDRWERPTGHVCKHVASVLENACEWESLNWAEKCPECGSRTYVEKRAV